MERGYRSDESGAVADRAVEPSSGRCSPPVGAADRRDAPRRRSDRARAGGRRGALRPTSLEPRPSGRWRSPRSRPSRRRAGGCCAGPPWRDTIVNLPAFGDAQGFVVAQGKQVPRAPRKVPRRPRSVPTARRGAAPSRSVGVLTLNRLVAISGRRWSTRARARRHHDRRRSMPRRAASENAARSSRAGGSSPAEDPPRSATPSRHEVPRCGRSGRRVGAPRTRRRRPTPIHSAPAARRRGRVVRRRFARAFA